jgi:FG-GAP-like repeat
MTILRTTILGVAAAVAMVGAADAGSVTLTGPTTMSGSYSTSALASLGAANPTKVVTFGGLTGISLWGLLGGAAATSPTSPVYGAITTTTPPGHNGKNAILRYYVVGIGSDGSQSVVSGGQIDPSFGATGTQVFVAYQDAGGSQLATPQLVVPNGPTGSTISSLASLQLLAFPALVTGAGGQSTTVTLTGNVTNPGAYTLTMLENNFMPVQVTVSGDTYTGIPLQTFVDTTSANINTQIVVGQATDGYEVVYSLSELANLSNILAYAATGTDFPADGVARTILPADNLHGRYLSNLLAVAAVNWTVGQMTTVTHDFNTDGMSDIVWQDVSADTSTWLMNSAQALQTIPIGQLSNWSLVGQRDFNGDGNADLLWRDGSGNSAIWFMSGGQYASSGNLGNIPNNWTVVAVADFNGDGYADILWQDLSGNMAMWP